MPGSAPLLPGLLALRCSHAAWLCKVRTACAKVAAFLIFMGILYERAGDVAVCRSALPLLVVEYLPPERALASLGGWLQL